MGAWGRGLLDNDTAGDLQVVWDNYIVPGRKRDPEFWTPEQIVEFFKSVYLAPFRALEPDGSTADEAILAVAALFAKHKIPLTGELRDIVEKAAAERLRLIDVAKEWDWDEFLYMHSKPV